MRTTFKQQGRTVMKIYNDGPKALLKADLKALNDAGQTLLSLAFLPNEKAVLHLNDLMQAVKGIVDSPAFDESTPEGRKLIEVLNKIQ